MSKSRLSLIKLMPCTFVFCMHFWGLNSWAETLGEHKKIVVEILADQNYKPISYLEDGKLVGLNTDIFELVNQRLTNFQVELLAVDWKQGLMRIKNGESFAIMGPFKTGKLRPWMYPYSDALYPERVVVICGDDVALERPVSWPNSFKNKLMLNIAGFDGWLNNQVRHRRFTRLMNFLEVPTVDVAADMVDRGNADCSLFESNVFNALNVERGAKNPLRAQIVATVKDSDVHVGYSLPARNKPENAHLSEFAREFDFALMELKLEGEIDKLLVRYNRQ